MINFANGIPKNLKNMIAGRSGEFFLHGIYDFDLHFLGWSNINSMNQVRMFHTASLLIDGKLLAAGGSDNPEYVIFY
jgi:hypothetical protein